MRTLSSNQFEYLPRTKKFIAEISDLGPNAMGQIFPDACDLGIEMHSVHTGKVAQFFVNEEKRDSGGDLEGWILIPTDVTLRKIPHLAGTTVVILND